MEDTEWLRGAAPRWSLAGDERLLRALQNLHQRIMCECSQTQSKLQEMVSALDDAALQLHNVNNRFLALSSNQFVESRVYEDDADVSVTEPAPAAPNKDTTPPSPDEHLKSALRVLASMHERVTILRDSDSESSESDSEERVVLKLKDMYESRPLPHIIGTREFNSKWHAGLVRSDSESDSECGDRQAEQYSSDDEEDTTPATDVWSPRPDLTPEEPHTPQSAHTQILQPQQEDFVEDEPVVRKLYAPYRPTPGVVFPDEPPPLGADEPESESDEDIFAELHRSADRGGVNNTSDVLFGTDNDKRMFGDYIPTGQSFQQPAKPKSGISEVQEQDIITDKQTDILDTRPKADNTKKPVGGMSLFGSNMAESIGDAILKRNQRQASSGDESDTPAPIPDKPRNEVKKPIDVEEDREKEKKIKERDIFDDLFAKSEKMQKKQTEAKIKDNKPVEKKEKKVDLFSDNIFDDIDDIFTSNVITKVSNVTKTKEKSLFDDDNDIFADIALAKTETKKVNSIFDSDDDLFSDKPTNTTNTTKEVKRDTKTLKDNMFQETDTNRNEIKDRDKTSKDTKVIENSEKVKSVFKDNDFLDKQKESKSSGNNKASTKSQGKNILFESDDENLFNDSKFKDQSTNKNTLKDNEVTHSVNSEVKKDMFDDSDDDIFLDKPKQKPDVKSRDTKSQDNAKSKVSSLFAEDDDDDDLFLNVKDKQPNKSQLTSKSPNPSLVINNDDHQTVSKEGSKKAIVNSPDLFDDDDSNDLFIKSKKLDKENNIQVEVKPNKVIENKNVVQDGNVSQQEVDKVETRSNEDVSKTQKLNTESIPAADDRNYEIQTSKNNNILRVESRVDSIQDNNRIQVKEEAILESKSEKPIIHTEVDAEIDNADTKLIKTTKDNVESDIPDNKNLENLTSFLDNMKDTDTNDNVTKGSGKDIFDDLFDDVPPELEITNESKKSKNVNALFDDDSDDETLFFKKTDPTLDEKPEEFNTNSNNLFGIFHDEPPAIDVDFTQKVSKNNLEDGAVKEKSVKTFKSDEIVKQKVEDEKDIFKINSDDFFSQKLKEPAIEETVHDRVTTEVPKQEAKEHADKTDGTQKVEPKKVGKLKPMNFNINVNSLLPGASPKKVQKPAEPPKTEESIKQVNTDQKDGQILSTKSHDELNKVIDTNIDTKLAKSVSFEGKPGSPILDNKLSKERAKIQVKRRPSTRRARREAVMKSGIDFGEDSTDNSSSIDDAPKKGEIENEARVEEKATKDEVKVTEDKVDSKVKIEEKSVIEHVEENITNEPKSNPMKSSEVVNIKDEQNIVENVDNSVKPEVSSIVSSKDVKSKVVYILDDEDIFSKPNTTNENKNVIETIPKPETDNIFADDDIFNTIPVATKTETPEREGNTVINTLGKVYETKEQKQTKTNIFDDDSDDDIFQNFTKNTKSVEKVINIDTGTKEATEVTKEVATTSEMKIKEDIIINKLQNEEITTKFFQKEELTANKPVKEVKTVTKAQKEVKTVNKPQKYSLFDESDDEDELFKSKTTTNKKSTIFSSDSDDDLFSGKSLKKELAKKEIKKELAKKEIKKEVPKKEVVKKEVKSLFEEDDDDELFGAKKKKDVPESTQHVLPSKTISEPTSQDPLSFLTDE